MALERREPRGWPGLQWRDIRQLEAPQCPGVTGRKLFRCRFKPGRRHRLHQCAAHLHFTARHYHPADRPNCLAGCLRCLVGRRHRNGAARLSMALQRHQPDQRRKRQRSEYRHPHARQRATLPVRPLLRPCEQHGRHRAQRRRSRPGARTAFPGRGPGYAFVALEHGGLLAVGGADQRESRRDGRGAERHHQQQSIFVDRNHRHGPGRHPVLVESLVAGQRRLPAVPDRRRPVGLPVRGRGLAMAHVCRVARQSNPSVGLLEGCLSEFWPGSGLAG